MGKSTDILPMPEALPGLGIHGVVFHNGKGYYYTCKEYCSSIEKRTYECVKPDCKGTATIRSLGSPMVEVCRHNHAPDYTYRNKCVVFHLIQQRFIQEHGSPVDILQDILASFADTLDTNDYSNFQEDTAGNFTNVKSTPVTPTVSDRPRKSRRHSLRSNSSGQLNEEMQSQSSDILETPADCVATEDDDHSSNYSFKAQATASLPDFKPTTGTAPAQPASSGERKRSSLRSSKKTPATEKEQPCPQPTTSQTQSLLRESEPDDRIGNENYFSDDNFDAQDDDSVENDDNFDTDPEYTPAAKRKKDNESSTVFNDSREDVEDEDKDVGEESGDRQTHSLNRKKCKELAANQEKESVPILIKEVKSEIEIMDAIEPSTSTNQAKELPALLNVLGLEQLVDLQRQSGEMTKFENDHGHDETFTNPRKKQKSTKPQRNRYTWSREEEIREAIAEGRTNFGPIEFYLSTREKVNIAMDGYFFYFKLERPNGSSRWACTMKHCKSVLDLEADMGFRIEREHQCQRKDINNIEVKKAKYIIKKRVAEESTKIATIYKEEMAKLIQRGIKVPKGTASANISSNCYTYRKNLIAAGEYTPMDGLNIEDYLQHDQDYEVSTVTATENSAES